ncbi:MAG: SPASM domain-containing protein, partial [Syntrophales bacterium]|nr:SPASM domain-containing protein [Syntrophales bacterium]
IKLRFPVNDESFFVGMDKKSWEKNFCQGIKFSSIISCDGGIYPCWRAWGKKDYCYGSLYENTFEEIWKSERRRIIDESLMNTPPMGDECAVCNITKLNEILNNYRNSNTQWKNFLI